MAVWRVRLLLLLLRMLLCAVAVMVRGPLPSLGLVLHGCAVMRARPRRWDRVVASCGGSDGSARGRACRGRGGRGRGALREPRVVVRLTHRQGAELSEIWCGKEDIGGKIGGFQEGKC